MHERPYLILTLRRTGGTSLMSFLSRVSRFPVVQHEPFNIGRTWGDVTRTFRRTGDVAAMARAVAARLEAQPNIKHCFETLPLRLTLALIEACAARDYAIFLLTRRNEASRIRSLFLAQATGAWGAKRAAEVYPRIRSGEVTVPAVRLGMVRKRVDRDAAAVGHLLRFLRHRSIAHQWLLFEEVYAPDGNVAARAHALAAGLGIDLPADHPELLAFSGSFGQSSGDILPFLPNADALSALLDEICPS